MSPRRRDESPAPFDYEGAVAATRQAMATLHLPRFDELPHIELYLDQVLSIVSSELAPLYDEGERIITGSMVNNYVKQRVIPAPTRRRYTRGHLARLLAVCVLKRVLPIGQVAQLMTLCGGDDTGLADIYDQFCDRLERALALRFRSVGPEGGQADGQPSAAGATQADVVPERLLAAAVELVANRVYLERMLALVARREQASEPSGS